MVPVPEAVMLASSEITGLIPKEVLVEEEVNISPKL